MSEPLFEVRVKGNLEPLLETLPQRVQFKLLAIVADLRRQGPMPQGWPTLIRLVGNQYRCHLDGRWLMGWSVKGSVIELLPPGSAVGRMATWKVEPPE